MIAGRGVDVDPRTLLSIPSFLLIVASVLTLAASAVLLRRYRRAVVRLMTVRGADPGLVVAGQPPWLGAPPPTGRPLEAASPPSGTAPAGHDAARSLRERRLLHIVITIGAAVFVGTTYALLYLVWNDLEILPWRYTLLALVFSWPAAPGVWVASDGDVAWTAWTAAVLFLAPLLILVANGTNPVTALVGWLSFNGLGTVVVAAFFTRAFRAVGVCLLGVVLAGLVGSRAIMIGLTSDAVVGQLLDATAPAGDRSANLVFWGTMGTGFAVAGAFSWGGFAWLARRYARQSFSDHMLLLGSLCLVFCLDYVTTVGAGEPVPLAIGASLFVALTVLVTLAFRGLVPDVAPVRLLVLRVFGDARGTARLLDAVGARWRHLGPVAMIGGPDLATSNVEPDEFLTFMGGRLRRLFIATGRDIVERLRTAPPDPDPDGRFRLEEWYCFDTTWRASVEALLTRSDVVLMDLRGFTPQRQGAWHELGLLARTGAFTRTVLVVDATTDAVLLGSILAASATQPRVVRLEGASPAPVVDALTAVTGRARALP
jgi:hypothetical protein